MKWQESIGMKGKAHVTKSEGNKEGVFFNNVGYYIDPVAKGEPAAKSKEVDEWS